MSEPSIKPNQAQVVIIGAGLAGLSCAKTLISSGHSVIVLEAQEKAGGRVRTETLKWSVKDENGNSVEHSVSVDVGAALIHGPCAAHPITQLLNQNNIVTISTPFTASTLRLHDTQGQLTEDDQTNWLSQWEQLHEQLRDVKERRIRLRRCHQVIEENLYGEGIRSPRSQEMIEAEATDDDDAVVWIHKLPDHAKLLLHQLFDVSKPLSIADAVDVLIRIRKMDDFTGYKTFPASYYLRALTTFQISSELGGCLDDIAVEDYGEESALSDADEQMVVGGIEQIIPAMTKGIDIRYNQPVISIEHTSPPFTSQLPRSPSPTSFCLSPRSAQFPIQVVTSTAEFECQRVVLTVPVSVIQQNKISIFPPLPHIHQEAISGLGMAAYNKLTLVFDKQFWPVSDSFQTYFHFSQPEIFIIDMTHQTKYPVLQLNSYGKTGREWDELPESEVLSRAAQLLTSLFSPPSNTESSAIAIPSPVCHHLTHWHSSPYSLGSYSYTKPHGSRHSYDHLSAGLHKWLYLAGEACHPTANGTLHGAYISGVSAAELIQHHILFAATASQLQTATDSPSDSPITLDSVSFNFEIPKASATAPQTPKKSAAD